MKWNPNNRKLYKNKINKGSQKEMKIINKITTYIGLFLSGMFVAPHLRFGEPVSPAIWASVLLITFICLLIDVLGDDEKS